MGRSSSARRRWRRIAGLRPSDEPITRRCNEPQLHLGAPGDSNPCPTKWFEDCRHVRLRLTGRRAVCTPCFARPRLIVARTSVRCQRLNERMFHERMFAFGCNRDVTSREDVAAGRARKAG
jgi:hypothetical protein